MRTKGGEDMMGIDLVARKDPVFKSQSSLQSCEADVRRIIREELKKAGLTIPKSRG